MGIVFLLRRRDGSSLTDSGFHTSPVCRLRHPFIVVAAVARRPCFGTRLPITRFAETEAPRESR